MLNIHILGHKLILINLVFLFISSNSYSDSKQWRRLLLFQRDHESRSLVNADAKFFLTSKGYQNPEEELVETLRNFLHPEDFISRGEGDPQCVYPARFSYLKKRYNLKITKKKCPALTEWKSRLKAQEISIVYATQFVSNPASVMGHTFLKFKDPKVKDFLNTTIGYAAEVNVQDNAFIYAFKGLTGNYPGKIFENPFYEKVHEYSNMEQRDIWEYVLNLDAEQSDQLLNLLWEIKTRAEFPYYFLDENCSYMILAFIEAVVPEVELTNDYGLFVTPYMTLIRLNQAKLIKDKRYRPSIRSQLVHQYENLNNIEKNTILKDIQNLEVNQTGSTLYYDTLISYSLLQKHRNEGNLKVEQRNFFNQAMLTRSKQKNYTLKTAPFPSSPLEAHRPRFMHLGLGNLSQGSYQYLEFRPGIHGLNDPSSGFLTHSNFSFLESKVRYFSENNQLLIGKFLLAELQNTNLIHPIDPKLSWKINMQYLDRDLLVNNEGIYEGQFLIGGASSFLGIDFIFLQGLKEQISRELENGHVTWLKTDLKFRKEKRNFLLDLSPSISKALINGPNVLRLDTTFDLRLLLPQQHLQIGPTFSYQRLLDGKKSYFDHFINVIYDF